MAPRKDGRNEHRKFENRNPKPEARSNSETRISRESLTQSLASGTQSCPSHFDLRISFGARFSEFGFGRSALILFCLLASLLASTTFAIIPEPDNILYGTVSLGGQPVTADMTNFVIEARRSTNGVPIASYRMGSDSQVGSYYSLRISIESVSPVTDTNASQAGDALFIILRDDSGIRGQTNFTIVERGVVQRADFGMTVNDVDGDGLPDPWELITFGTLTNGPGTITLNGQTVLQHFIAGTDPNNPNSGFWLYIARSTNNQRRVWFTTISANGPGYEGLTRLYTLQYKPFASGGFWANVPGYVNVVGTNQTVEYFTPGAGSGGFYRCCISLLGFSLPGGGSGPLLTINRTSPDTAQISWPSPSTGFLVQENADLKTTNWVPSTATVSDDGTIKFITVNAPAARRFYRLIKSP